MNELKIVVTQKQGVISTNFDDVKTQLSNQMKVYKELEVTEDNKVERKRDIATLRKIKKALDDRRIEVKKDYLKPCDEFELKVKELTTLIDDPIILINKQVKELEELQAIKKKQDIKDTYSELAGDVKDYIPLDKIYNSKWDNISTTIKAIKEEIESVVSSTSMAVNTIKGMKSESVPKALEQYKNDLSLANAIAYINRYEQQKAEILAKEEQKRKEEEERKRIAEEYRIKEQEKQNAIEEERKRVAEEKRIQAEKEKIREEERLRAEAKLREIEQAKAQPVSETPRTWAPNPIARESTFRLKNESREVDEAPFTEEPFDTEDPFILEEQPFNIAIEKIIYEISATDAEFIEINALLDGLNISYQRRNFSE